MARKSGEALGKDRSAECDERLSGEAGWAVSGYEESAAVNDEWLSRRRGQPLLKQTVTNQLLFLFIHW